MSVNNFLAGPLAHDIHLQMRVTFMMTVPTTRSDIADWCARKGLFFIEHTTGWDGLLHHITIRDDPRCVGVLESLIETEFVADWWQHE